MHSASVPPVGTDVVVPPHASPPNFAEVAREFGLTADFPAPVLSEVEHSLAVDAAAEERVDATDLPLVTLDPPGAKDLDQAVLIERRGSGYRIRYAIADMASFVRPGGALDTEARRRGQTMYLPGLMVPLHPPALSEDAASVLADQVRRAVLWTIDLDAAGAAVRAVPRRCWIRSQAQWAYGDPAALHHPSLALLPEVGRLRRQQALRRGVIEPAVPEQRVEPDEHGGWRLTLRTRSVVQDWNAEISLLTGMCAARIMLDAGIGVVRTVPDPAPEAVARLRESALALGLDWPEGHSAGQVLSGVDLDHPGARSLHLAATRLLRGAGYVAFDGQIPEQVGHAGIGAAYAHVTAPLRRLVDRYTTEVCLAITADRPVPEGVRTALPELPGLMGRSDRVANQAERVCLSRTQGWLMANRVGEEFDATVLRVLGDAEREVLLDDPPVIARCAATGVGDGQPVRVRLVGVDEQSGDLSFESV